MKKYRPRTSPNLSTVQKIQELAKYREQNRDKLGRPPNRRSACRKLRIDYRTVQRYASELLGKWNDEAFHW